MGGAGAQQKCPDAVLQTAYATTVFFHQIRYWRRGEVDRGMCE